MSLIAKEVQEKLVHMAEKARENAYAPYSNYRVGVAVLLADGSIQTGCNVENASYGASICAERVAYCAAIAGGKRDFVALALVTSSEIPVAPCGVCRQFMSEFNSKIPVFMANDKGESRVATLDELLPLQFSKADLA